ncbi:MAG TPA: hypothetical protein ENJ97_03930, partial [Planctomycetes bacterium]|nr:hypothetical protein [Planctomycetota bacterium]
MALLKGTFLCAAFFSIGSLSLPAQETGMTTRPPARAVDLIPGSSCLVVRSFSYSMLWKLLEHHPLWKLYGQGERGKALDRLARVLGEKL